MEIGDKIPEILGRDANGKEIKSSDYRGKKFALYFYPKDNSQACSLKEGYHDLQNAGLEVIGGSVDDEKSHQKFITKYELPFPLIADTDKKLVEAFGVWGEKKMYGRTYFGTYRTTFIIDEEGKVEHIITPKSIKVKEHAAQLLKLVK